MKKQLKKKIKASDFDKSFDDGKEDVVQHLDLKSAKAQHAVHRINIDIPAEILQKVDREAARMGVPRTSLIKVWIAEHTDRLAG